MNRTRFRHHRDPRSLLELRRLAYRVPRDEDSRIVLIDALLETYPEVFLKRLELADHWAERERREQAIFFLPSRLHPKIRLQYRPDDPFLTVRDEYDIAKLSTKRWEKALQTGSLSRTISPEYKNAVLVYRTSSKSHL